MTLAVIAEARAILNFLLIIWIGVSLCWVGMELLAIWARGRWEGFRAGRLQAHASWRAMWWFGRIGGLGFPLALAVLELLGYRLDRNPWRLAYALLWGSTLAVFARRLMRMRQRQHLHEARLVADFPAIPPAAPQPPRDE